MIRPIGALPFRSYRMPSGKESRHVSTVFAISFSNVRDKIPFFKDHGNQHVGGQQAGKQQVACGHLACTRRRSPSQHRADVETGLISGSTAMGSAMFGLNQILSDVGISKTAFYKHFESKEDLMMAVLETQVVWMQQTFRQMVCERGGSNPRDQLRALFDVVERIMDSPDFQGCIFVNASIEFPLPHEPAYVAAAKSKESMETVVREIATAAGASDPTALAQELCLIMEGAYVTRHVTGNRQTMAIARRAAEAVISAHLR
jgi:AcrR family transcriptional regulator